MNNANEKRVRITTWLDESTVTLRNAGTVLGGFNTRSEFVEKAIQFYSGYLNTKAHPDYFAKALSDIVEGTIKTSENRIARLLFKVAVELAKLQQLLASVSDIDDETLRLLHLECINEVKKINGIIDMESVFNSQK